MEPDLSQSTLCRSCPPSHKPRPGGGMAVTVTGSIEKLSTASKLTLQFLYESRSIENHLDDSPPACQHVSIFDCKNIQLVGGLEHFLFFQKYWECHHPN